MTRDVWCSACRTVIAVEADPLDPQRVFRSTQDHELEVHADHYGETVYRDLSATEPLDPFVSVVSS